jgi:DNA polymerase I
MSLLGKSDYAKVPTHILHEYAAMDADAGKSIYKPMKEVLKEEGSWEYYNGHVRETLLNLIEASVGGMKISKKKLKDLKAFIAVVTQAQLDKLKKVAGAEFNPNSPDQVKAILFDKKNLPVLKTTPTGSPSTDSEVLEELVARTGDSFIRTLLEYKALSKLQSTYILGFEKHADADWFIHPSFKLAGAITGRITSEAPATTNLSRDKEYSVEGDKMSISLKEMFIAPTKEHFFGTVDYSQVELQLLAIISGDQEMIRIFKERLDLHSECAYDCFDDCSRDKELDKERRNAAKTVNFSLVYGAGAVSIAARANVSIEVIEDFMAKHQKKFRAAHKFLDTIPDVGLKDGKLISPFGRVKHVRPYSRGDEKTLASIRRELRNFVPQNCGMELTARAMNRIVKVFRKHPEWDASIRNIYYDALQFYGKKEYESEIKEAVLTEMLRPVPELDGWVFPCDYGVGSNWSKAEKAGMKYYSIDELTN